MSECKPNVGTLARFDPDSPIYQGGARLARVVRLNQNLQALIHEQSARLEVDPAAMCDGFNPYVLESALPVVQIIAPTDHILVGQLLALDSSHFTVIDENELGQN